MVLMHNMTIEHGPMHPGLQHGAQSVSVHSLLPDLARRCPASLCALCGQEPYLQSAPSLCLLVTEGGALARPDSALYADAGPESSLDERKALKQLGMSVAAGMHHQQDDHSKGQVVIIYSSRV